MPIALDLKLHNKEEIILNWLCATEFALRLMLLVHIHVQLN